MPRYSKTRSQGIKLLQAIFGSSFPLILAKRKIEPATSPGGRVSFQTWKVRGLTNPVILKLDYFGNIKVICTLHFYLQIAIVVLLNIFKQKKKSPIKISYFYDFLRENNNNNSFYLYFTQNDIFLIFEDVLTL